MSKKEREMRYGFRLGAVVLIVLILVCAAIGSVGCKKAETSEEKGQSDTPDLGESLSFEAYGRITEYSTYAPGEALTDTFYYKNAWFGEPATTRNDALALLSMQLSAAAITDDPDGSGARALRALGFGSIGFVGFETEDPDDCAYTWATKVIDGKKLVVIVFQSYAMDRATKVKGWTQNFHVNDESASGEHAGFKKAVEKALDGIASLGGEGAKYWIMGQSRAGALANLTAAKLADRSGIAKDGIYAYTFEAPATVDGALAEAQKGKFTYIHNYASSDDIVPFVPMWGMTLYGNRYEVKSEATELALSAELQRLGSRAAGIEFGSDEAKIRSLVDHLEHRLSADTISRADYSAVRREVLRDGDGELVTVEYNYQEVMEHLIRAIFSGEFSEIDVEGLEEDLSIFASSVYALAAALKGEAGEDAITVATNYHQAAQGLRNLVNGLIARDEVSLSDVDFYALLRLAAPLMLDIDYEEEGDPKRDVSGYIYPTIELAQSFGNLTYAHHFDTVIARLKTLAPQPEVPVFSAMIAEPKKGDDIAAFPAAFAETVRGLGISWLSLRQARWMVDESVLADGAVYYFEGRFEIIGHRLSEEFTYTLNGRAPIEMAHGYTDGALIVDLRWEFVIGTPEKVTLRFSSAHDAALPAEMLVDKGKMLRYAEKPDFADGISDGGKKYLFDRWIDAGGKEWDEITATSDVTLDARWIVIIDEVALTFDTPVLGGEFRSPELPEDAPYRISEYHVQDMTTYYFVEPEEITAQAGEYSLNLFIVAIEGGSVFAEETTYYEDYDETTYTGTVTLNGEAWEDFFYEVFEGSRFLCVGFSFVVE